MAIRQPRPSRSRAPARSRYDGVRMSVEEYLALPEEKPGLEYWDGVVIQKAVGNYLHGKIQFIVGHLLYVYWSQRGGSGATEARSFFEAHGYRLPDQAYWAPGKPTAHGDDALPPTLAVEIRSPGESMEAQRRKCRDMRANGVDVCWLIDPRRRRIERFEDTADGEPFPADGVLGSPHLPGFAFPVADFWAELDRMP